MQLTQSPETLLPLSIRKYTSFDVSENVAVVIGGHEIVVHVQALPQPFVFKASCQSPQSCALGTFHCMVAVTNHTDTGYELMLYTWSVQKARETEERESKLTKHAQVQLTSKPIPEKCLTFSNDEAFLVCVLLNDVLIYELSDGIFVYASSAVYLNRQDDFFCSQLIKHVVLSSGLRVYAAVLSCKNQTISILPFKYCKEENTILLGEFRSLIHLSFIPTEVHCDQSHLVCHNTTNLAVVPYKQFVSVLQKSIGPELSIKLFPEQQVPLGYFPGARKIFTTGLGLFMDPLAQKDESIDISDSILGTTLLIDTDVGIFGVPMNSIALINVVLAERSGTDPDSLEMCLDKECINTYSVLSSIFEKCDGRNHFYIVEASNHKLYLFQSRMIATVVQKIETMCLENLSIGYIPKPKSYEIVFGDLEGESSNGTWILPVTSVLNPNHPRIVLKTKLAAPSAPARSSYGAGSANLRQKKAVSVGAQQTNLGRVKSSGYSTSMPWSEQQKLKIQRAKQERARQTKAVTFAEDTANPIATLNAEADYLRCYARIKNCVLLSSNNPIIYTQALDDGSFAYLSADNCISFYAKTVIDKVTSLKLKMSIVPSTHISMFSVHPSSQLILTPGPNASLGLWRTTASNRKEILTLEPRKKSPHETAWCTFIWPRSDTEGLCVGASNTSLSVYQYALCETLSESTLRGNSMYTELGLLDLPQVIYGGACFTRLKSPACFLTHTKDKAQSSDLVSIIDIARMKKVTVISSEDSPHTRSPSVFLPDFTYANLGTLTINLFATSASGMTSGEVSLYDVRQKLVRPIRLFKGVTSIKANPRVSFLPKCNGLAVSGDDGRILIYDIRSSGVVFDSSAIFRTHSPTGGLSVSDTGAIIGGCHDGKFYMISP